MQADRTSQPQAESLISLTCAHPGCIQDRQGDKSAKHDEEQEEQAALIFLLLSLRQHAVEDDGVPGFWFHFESSRAISEVCNLCELSNPLITPQLTLLSSPLANGKTVSPPSSTSER
eukprot:768473-Hanusia_phi.AAC.19